MVLQLSRARNNNRGQRDSGNLLQCEQIAVQWTLLAASMMSDCLTNQSTKKPTKSKRKSQTTQNTKIAIYFEMTEDFTLRQNKSEVTP